MYTHVCIHMCVHTVTVKKYHSSQTLAFICCLFPSRGNSQKLKWGSCYINFSTKSSLGAGGGWAASREEEQLGLVSHQKSSQEAEMCVERLGGGRTPGGRPRVAAPAEGGWGLWTVGTVSVEVGLKVPGMGPR